MDAIELIRRDHDKFRDLFEKFESKADGARERIANELFATLKAHEGMEEEVFFPALQKRVSGEGEFEIKEGVQEHHVAGLLIGELRDMDFADEEFEPKFKVLQENVEHHLEEEEEEILPRAEQHFSQDELDRLGQKMADVRRRLLDEEKR